MNGIWAVLFGSLDPLGFSLQGSLNAQVFGNMHSRGWLMMWNVGAFQDDASRCCGHSCVGLRFAAAI